MKPVTSGLTDFQKFSYYILFTLKFPCITPESPRLVHQVWEVVSWLSVFLPLHLCVCHTAYVFENFQTESIDNLSNIGIQAVWLFCSFWVMVSFKVMSKHLEDLFHVMDTTFQWRSMKAKTYVTIERCYKYAKFVSIMWQAVPPSSVVINLIRPLFRRPLVLPSVPWYPLDVNNPFYFALAYFLQSWSQLIVVYCFAAASTLLFSFCFLCCGQFNILRCELKNLVFISGLYKRFPETLELINAQSDSASYVLADEMEDAPLRPTEHAPKVYKVEDIEETPVTATKPPPQRKEELALTPEEVRNFKVALVNAINKHRHLQKVCRLMETFLNMFAFFRVFELTLQMCFMAFVFTKNNDIITFLFGALAGFDLYLLTFPPELITFQNALVGSAVLTGPWYLVAKHFRNEFIIMLEYSLRPVQFTSGKIVILNADRLRLAITATFSYYSLLSSFDKN